MTHEFTRQQAFKRGLAMGIPDRMVDSLINYIWHGQPVGGFLQAVIAGDLFDAAGRADPINIHLLKQYCHFFYNVAPPGCFGSREIYKAWIESGGLSRQNMESNHET